MISRDSVTFAATSLVLIGSLCFSPVFAQEENPTTPGAIPSPSTYQGSTELQRQSDQQDQQFRQQQQQQQSSYPGQSQQGGYRSSQSSGGQSPSWAECYDHIPRMPAFAPLAGKITLGYADPAAVELFDEQSKPTAAERILLAKWDDARRYCESLRQDDPRTQTPPILFAASHWGYPATRALVIQLLNGQITFGQFNYQRALNARAMQRYRNQAENH